MNNKINDGASTFLIYDESFKDFWDCDFYKFLKKEGFEVWENCKGLFKDVCWVYVNVNSKVFTLGMPGVRVTDCVCEHAITLEEFFLIYQIYKKYEGLEPLRFK